MDTVELEVFGAPAWTREWVHSTLGGAGFRVKWQDDLCGTAQRGDPIDGWLLGPRSAWLKVAVQVGAGRPVAGGRSRSKGGGGRAWSSVSAARRGERSARRAGPPGR
ncbi:MAG: hypothetical protein M0Z42_13635 [Actinomycetota bacterium]|nr:hypothetical protein [Actinomycetota bacterium]